MTTYVVLAHLNFEVEDPDDLLNEQIAADWVRDRLSSHSEQIVLVETVEVRTK